MAKTKIHVQTDFDLLQVQVTDDQATVDAGFEKLKKKMLDWKVRGTKDQRDEAESFFKAYEERLKKPDKREILIQEVFGLAANNFEMTLHGHAGKKLTDAVYGLMLKVLVEEYNFERGLADRRLKKHLQDRHIEIDKIIVLDVGGARLVDEVRAESKPNGVLVSWTLPTADCDGVVLVRTQSGPPKTTDEGVELTRGKTDHWLDEDVKTGRKYTYAVFSVLAGKPSGSCRHCTGYCLPEGVESFQARFVSSGVQLQWFAPENCRKVSVYRSAEEIRFPASGIKGGAVPPGCVQIASTTEERFLDGGVTLGATFFYHAVAEFDEGMVSSPATIRVTVPAPLSPPRGKNVQARVNCIVLEWESTAREPHGYRLYRSAEAGLTDLEKAQPLYEGIDTRFDDATVETGKAYWYYVVAQVEGLASSPTRLGPAVAMGEVKDLQAIPGDRKINLKWTAPEGAIRLVVRRREGASPESLKDGTDVPAAAKGATDGGLTAGKLYGYRVACVFRDPDGREMVSPGLTTVPCKPFQMPPAPRNVKAAVDKGQVTIAWEPGGSGPLLVFCRPTDPASKGGLTASLAELASGGRRLRPEGGRSLCDPFNKAQPWYLLVTPVNETIGVVHKRILVVDLQLKAGRQGTELKLSWPWPPGVDRADLVRQIFDAAGAEDPKGKKTVSVQRATGSDQGQYVEEIADLKQAHSRAYRLQLPPPSDPSLLIVDAGSPPALLWVGPAALLRYQIVRKKSFFGKEGPPRLRLQLDKAVDDFPGVKLVAQPPKARGDEGEVLLEWPEDSESVGPVELELDIPRPRATTPVFGRLFFRGPHEPKNVKLIHPAGRDEARL